MVLYNILRKRLALTHNVLRRLLSSAATIVALAMLLQGCGRAAQNPEPHAAAPKSEPDPVPHDRTADDMGRFIAGLPGTPGSRFASLEAGAAWQEHRERLDAAWRKADGDLISRLRSFQNQELNQDSVRFAPIFYPFGGPDALTVTSLFPQSPVYVVVGLEPSGTLPGLRDIEKMDLAKFLANTRETMASELGRSFFITHQMDTQFRGQVTDGLLQPILQLLVRTHNRVIGFRYVRLDDNGRIIERAASYKAPGRFGNKGIQIEFQTDANQSLHTLYYFTVNLSDERLRENKPFQTYLSHLNGFTTLLKATSYMTHRATFSLIRDSVLANSAAILQDDSGIPYKWFEPRVWKVQLYGAYDRPYGSFRWFQQPDLRDAYSTLGAKPLTLRIGYGFSKVESNLLLARRAN